jgi:hypothetical protein
VVPIIARSRTKGKVRDGRRFEGERRHVEALAPSPEEETDNDD